MSKQIQNPIPPQDFWASQMGKAHQVADRALAQGPAFSKEPEEEWSDGNGY